MRVTVLGASPACPNPGGASAGYLVECAGQRVLIDCGHGVAGKVQEHVAIGEIDAIVISHMHADHIFDLEPLNYGVRFTQSERIPLFLPPDGRETLERLRMALGLEEHFWDTAYVLSRYDPAETLSLGPLSIEFAPTVHFVPAYAMRLTDLETGGVLGYSSDTGWTETVIDLIREADLAIIEATLVGHAEESGFHGHLTAAEAGQMAREAGVQRLLLTHHWHTVADRILSEGQSTFGPEAKLAESGRTYEV